MTASLSTPAAASTWTIDPAHSLVEFAARHMMITTVKGRFGELEGTILLDETDPRHSSVDVRIGAASIDTRSAQRDQHLRSADFLDVEHHPELRFRSMRIEGSPLEPEAEFRLIGELTIRGETREVVLAARLEGRGTDPWGAEKLSFSAATTIDRRDFGLTWNAALETGGVLVSNDVRIQLEVQAARA